MLRTATFKCPYCGVANLRGLTYEETQNYKALITCDYHQGGCSRDFVVKIGKEVMVRILKVEGEDD